MHQQLIWLFAILSVNLLISSTVAQCADGSDSPVSKTQTSTVADSAEVRDFEVRVDNRAVGTHSLSIKSSKEKCEATLKTDVKLDFIVYAYVFKLRGTEIWRDGRVESVDIRCEDGSQKRSFSLKTEGEIQQLSFNGKSNSDAPLAVMTTAYWCLPHEQMRAKPLKIADVDHGGTQSASLRLVGDATVSCGSNSLPCQHYKIDGPSPAELWFDDQSRLVRQKSIEQGHLTELRLKQIRIVKKPEP